MKPAHRIDVLLARARASVLERIGELRATPENLEMLATHTRLTILAQVLAGEWSKLGIGSTEPEKLADLRVNARLGRGFHEPAVVLEYDFSQTALPLVKVACRQAS